MDFCIDILKKLIVSVLAAPLLSIATIFWFRASEGFLLSYDRSWYSHYWFLVLFAAIVVIIQGYVTLNSRRTVIYYLIFSSLFVVFYCSFSLRNDLNLTAIYDRVPLWVFFFTLNLILFQICLILCFFAQRLAVNILGHTTR
jgi:hypothetical protein